MSRDRRHAANSIARTLAGREETCLPALRSLSSVVCLLFSALLCGCESNDGNAPMAESFYLNPYRDVHSMGRVVLVELENGTAYPEISAQMTTALFAALQKKQLFGVTIMQQDDPTWQELRQQLSSLTGLKQIGTMREALKSDGLMVGTITQYVPYPRMILGLRLTLLDLTDGQVLWGLEQVWDSSDNSTRKRIRSWSSAASLREDLVVMSSLNFTKFVAYEIAQTFEQKKAPPATAGPVRTTWQY
jgi:hypothetical protein